jgi:serine/threonine protein kinase
MTEPQSAPRVAAKGLIGGRFERGRLIGRGAMGEVYAARHVITGRQAALKFIRLDGRSERSRAGRFLREARIASRLRHPNIVEVIDAFEEGGDAIIVMELLVGEPLSVRRERAGTMPLDDAAAIMVPVARALAAAHQKGVVHRDLKPDNIFLASEGRSGTVPKVLDFGIAKVFGHPELSAEVDGYATRTGAVVGTPHYMAPEQAMSDRDIDGRADVWSLGVILFEMLAGKRPIAFTTIGEMYKAHFDKAVLRARETIPHLPDDVADLLDRCLVVDKADRLKTVELFIAVLVRHVAMEAKEARAVSRVSWADRAGRAVGRFRVTTAVGLTTVAGVTAWAVMAPHARVSLDDPRPDEHVAASPTTLALGPRPAIPARPEPTEEAATAPAPGHEQQVRPAAAPSDATSLTAERRSASTTLSAPRHAPVTLPPAVSVSSVKRGILETPPY